MSGGPHPPAEAHSDASDGRAGVDGDRDSRYVGRQTRRDVLRTTAAGVATAGLVGSGAAEGSATCKVMFTCNAADGSVSLVDARAPAST